MPRRGAISISCNGFKKLAGVTPPLGAGGLVILFVWPALPAPVQMCAGIVSVLATVMLVAGAGESFAVRGLCGARPLSQQELAALQPVIADLSLLGLGPPLIRLYAARQSGATTVHAIGRESVVLSPEALATISTGQIQRRQAVAIIAHAASTVRSGMTRQDLTIRLWCLPWHSLMTLGMPFARLLKFAWRVRALVFSVAIWRNFTEDASAPTPPNGFVVGCALALVLALTYAGPFAARTWREHVIREADQMMVLEGLGPDLAAFLRRLPASSFNSTRIHELDPAPPVRLRLVSMNQRPHS